MTQLMTVYWTYLKLCVYFSKYFPKSCLWHVSSITKLNTKTNTNLSKTKDFQPIKTKQEIKITKDKKKINPTTKLELFCFVQPKAARQHDNLNLRERGVITCKLRNMKY